MEPLRPLRPFYLVAAMLVLAALVLEHVNGRFWLNDFRVYYMAADNMRHELPIYGEVFGEDTGLYKYAPVVLYFFQPYTFLSFHAAGVVHFLLIGVLLMCCFTVIERTLAHFTQDLPRAAARALLGLLCIAILLARELHLGNVNMGLLLLAAWGTERHISGRPVPAGIHLGIVWFVKPYLLLMLVPLVVRREWELLRTAAITMLAGALIPLLLEGPAMWWELLREWGNSMVHHTQVMESPDRISDMLGHYTGLGSSVLLNLVFIILAGLFLVWLTRKNIRSEDDGLKDLMDRTFELWLALAMVPNLVITDQQHFMFSLPLVLFILAYLFTHRDRQVLLLFIVGMILYATRSTDLWGRALENQLVGWGVLGLGNILLMAVAGHVQSQWRGTRGNTLPAWP